MQPCFPTENKSGCGVGVEWWVSRAIKEFLLTYHQGSFLFFLDFTRVWMF